MKFQVGEEYIYANKDSGTRVRFVVEDIDFKHLSPAVTVKVLDGFGHYSTISAFGQDTDLYHNSIHYKGTLVQEDLERLLK